jgi:DNA polymerase III alpha subunit (gram-positive type)
MRNIVLLGHDVEQDIQYCHKIGFSVLGRGNLIATMDTQAMYQAYTRDTSPRGLGGVMNDFDITAWHLHNAGNDAAYTIYAMLATCVQDAAERGTEASKKKHDERAKNKLESAIEAAKERAKEDAEGWDVSEDGGVPLPQPPSASGHYTLGGAPLDL